MFLEHLVYRLHNSIKRYEKPVSYLLSRGVTVEDIKNYKVGYSKVISVPEEDSLERERFIKETFRGKLFEGKVIFPLYDVLGRVMGLFGRSIDSKEFKFFLTEEAKYIGVFFGLLQALPYIYSTGKVFVVEGPFDLLVFKKIYPNVVSSITAGFYEAQYRILEVYADEIITVFDSDDPGREAAKIVKRKWKNIQSVDLGYGDPNSCFEALGQKKFEKYVRDKIGRSLLFV